MARSRLAGAAAVIVCACALPGLASPDAEERGRGGRDPQVREQQLLPALAALAAVLAVVAAVYVLTSRQWGTRARATA